MVVNARTLIPIGKGPISVFKGQSLTAKIWVLDMTEKQISILKLTEGVLRSGLLEKLQLFAEYPNVRIASAYHGYLKLDESSNPFPDPEPLFFLPYQIFEKIKIPVVKMSEMHDPKKMSVIRNGYYQSWDIRCIKNCVIRFIKLHERNIGRSGFKYQIGNISITDGSTNGYVTEHGIVIPSNFFCWMHPDFVYPVNSIGDAYGVLKIKGKSVVVLDLCYFDVIMEAPETEEKEVSQSPPKPKKIKKRKKPLIRKRKHKSNQTKLEVD